MERDILIIIILLASVTVFAQDPGWPRKFTNNGSILIVYLPQVEDWPGYQTLDFRMAFSLTPACQTKQVAGVPFRCDRKHSYIP